MTKRRGVMVGMASSDFPDIYPGPQISQISKMEHLANSFLQKNGQGGNEVLKNQQGEPNR